MLDAERTVSQPPTPILGGSATPLAESGIPLRAAGGALDVERPIVVAACACPPQVASARRQQRCPRCGAPVIRSINEHGRNGCTRHGREAQEVAAPMPDPSYPLAADALERSFLTPGQVQSTPAACPGCLDDLDGRMLLVREIDEDEDGQRIADTVVVDQGHGDGPTHLRCERCERAIEAEEVLDARRITVLRDRHRRCVRALAEVA